MKSTKALPLLMQKVPSLRLFLDFILEFLMEVVEQRRLLFDGETRAREGGVVIFAALYNHSIVLVIVWSDILWKHCFSSQVLKRQIWG